MIRSFTSADYPALARLATEAIPDDPVSAEEIAHRDTARDAKCRFARWVLEENGESIGFGEYSQRASMYHPRRFGVMVMVPPAQQGQGQGRALYEHVMQALAPFDPLSVRTQTREDVVRGVRFLRDRGFVEDMREFESRLEVAAFDPAPWAEAVARMPAQGIEFKTLAELEHVPGHLDKHYALAQELNADVPSPEPWTRVDKEFWRQRMFSNPGLLRGGYFFAVHNDEYVGMTILFSSQSESSLFTGLTAVRRGYRRRGIALALKLHAIAWAKAQGCPQIKTWNESGNVGMLRINMALGYVRQPAWLELVKTLKEE